MTQVRQTRNTDENRREEGASWDTWKLIKLSGHSCQNEKLTRSGKTRPLFQFFLSENILDAPDRSGSDSKNQDEGSRCCLSALDFWEITCAGNCSECGKQSLRVFQTHFDRVQAECSRRVPVPDPMTHRWKRPPEHTEGPAQPAKDPLHEEVHLPQTSKKRATKCTVTFAETNTSRGILELAERLGNFHDSAQALAVVFRTTTSPVRPDQRQPSACFTHCWRRRVTIWNV